MKKKIKIKELRERNGRFKKGFIPWNKGLGTKTAKCKTCNNRFPVIKFTREIRKGGKFCSWSCRWKYKYRLAKQFKLTPDMAELVGVIIGDGCINKMNGSNAYRITISGNKIEDKPYMDNYLPKLIKKCVGKEVKPFIAKNGAYVMQFYSEPFRIFLSHLGIKPNKGRVVGIPDEIKKNKIFLRRCIRGIADTDFTFIGANKNKRKNVYPRISATFASKKLVMDLEKSLRNFDFTLNTKFNRNNKDNRGHNWVSNYINLEGPHNLKRWLKLIGFANLRIITRYKYLKKCGYLPPKTTLPHRLRVLRMAGGAV